MKFRKDKTSLNYFVNTLYQLMLVMIPLFTMPHLSRTLGAEGIGLFSFNNSIVSYFILFAVLGSGSYGQREIAYHQDDKAEYSRIFWEIEVMRVVCSIISLLVLCGYIFKFGRNPVVLLILSFNVVNVFFDISWLYMGLEKFGPLAIRNIVVRCIYVFSIFKFVNGPEDIYVYIVIEVSATLIQSSIMWIGLHKLVDKPRKLQPLRHFKDIFRLFLPSLAIQLYTVLDKTMLGMFSVDSYAENGYYEQAQGIVRSCLVLISSLVMVMSPKISYCYANGEHEEMRKHLYFSYRFVWLITVLLLVTVSILSPYLIPLFLGPAFSKTIILVQICTPMFIIIGLSNVTGLQYFVPCDHIRSHTCSLIVGSVVNILLNLLLIPSFHAVGASIASVAAELCVTITQFVFLYKLKDLKMIRIFISSWKYLLAGLISGIILLISRSFLEMSWFNLIILLLIEFISYLGILFMLRDEMIIGYVRKLRSRMNERK